MEYSQLILVFTSIIYEALPFIVLGVVIAGFLEEFVPQQAISNVFPKNRFLAIGMGGVLGLVFPMCECGIIVVMRRLLKKGLPLSVCVAYMLGGPVINLVVMMSTYVAFNPNDPKFYIFGGPQYVVLIRVGLAYVVAVVTALVVERAWRQRGLDLLHPKIVEGLKPSALPMAEQNGQSARRTAMDRLGNISSTALNDFVEILTFLILGAALAALGREILKQTELESAIADTPTLSILLMMLIAILFCLCSEADAFVAANFQPLWPPASKMAFLVLGPMLDIKLYLMYTRVFRPRLIFTIILCVVTQVFVYNVILHYAAPYFVDLLVSLGWVEP